MKKFTGQQELTKAIFCINHGFCCNNAALYQIISEWKLFIIFYYFKKKKNPSNDGMSVNITLHQILRFKYP